MPTPSEYVTAAHDFRRMETMPIIPVPEIDSERVWLLSIMHSATHFAFQHLEIMGYRQMHIHWDRMYIKNIEELNRLIEHFLPVSPYHNGAGPKHFVHTHIGINPEWWRIQDDDKTVITLRNPIEVFRTHVWRYRWAPTQYVPYIVQAFRDMQAIADRFDGYLFRVDAPDQKGEVEALGRWLGARSWTYKEQDRNTSTRRVNGIECMGPHELFDNPPAEIQELAIEYGY